MFTSKVHVSINDPNIIFKTFSKDVKSNSLLKIYESLKSNMSEKSIRSKDLLNILINETTQEFIKSAKKESNSSINLINSIIKKFTIKYQIVLLKILQKLSNNQSLREKSNNRSSNL